ncbi:MAG TPA: glycosyltransferase family 39 protein [Opitutaceae bacterium]|nr:glycosyltransferase family 39 protein [Opitutaceae bacterium]
MSRPAAPARLLLPLVCAALLGWVLLLRWPSFSATLWNVDEAIHAAVARTLLDGGTLYRDAIDQRTPVTYWLVAGVFAIFGDNNLFALRLALAGLIAATAFILFLLARRARGTAAGLWAAGIFTALSTNLLPPSDAFAAHTEWAVIAFTTAGAWWFWRRASAPTFRSGAVTGALFALAFLSKQPALLDFAAPLAAAFWLGASADWTRRAAARAVAGLLVGFATPLALVALWFAHKGALDDALFYTWTYNVRFYGPEISALQRAASALQPFALLAHAYPAVLAAGLAGAILLALRLAQFRPAPALRAANAWHCFLLVWAGASLAGAASGGRGFEHYTIQCLPAFSLVAATALAEATDWARRWRTSARGVGLAAFAALALVAASLLWSPFAARRPEFPPTDPALEAAAFIRAHTTAADKLFVWGYNPDIHLYADRRPASRFVYCSFLTGLIPWTNLDPQKDTAYAIVPGAMETLLDELRRNRPAFIVDCSPGPHRNFHKYPIAAFPPLQALLDRDYAVTEPERFVPQGFRLHVLRDRARRTPLPLAGGPAVTAPTAPQLFGRNDPETQPTAYTVACRAPDGRLQRLELLVDGAVVDGVSVVPCDELSATLIAPFHELPAGAHQIVARATRADGSTTTSAPLAVTSGGNSVPAAQLRVFRMPVLAHTLSPLSVSAPFGPTARPEGSSFVYAVHAPSSMIFPLEIAARRVRGAFGIRPGAYAPDNNAPTDGARFRVLLLGAGGSRAVLLERLLRPLDEFADRPTQYFDLAIPPHAAGARLEFTTDPGPANNAACDWTFWSDLAIDCTE